jgi:adenosylmethionine---8-amino-7-oxononanoate aminotransferase
VRLPRYPFPTGHAHTLRPVSASTAELDHRHLWHPFTQQRGWEQEEPLVIESAEGTDLVGADGRRYIDGTSSLWCNVHGHRHPHVDAAVRAQLDRVAHSTMLGLTHGPAADLAARLTAIAPHGLNRVFYSDAGSTATEIALKMAFQYWRQKGGQHALRTSFIGLDDGYHGDTIGAVSVGGIDLFHGAYEPLLFAKRSVPAGDPRALAEMLERHGEKTAAVIVEPLVQGAGGILVQPAGYLRQVRELCDRHDVLLICDEVATGFGRTGTMFACEQERVVPDFLCLGKGLTNGYMPLAATLTTDRVYGGFLGEYEEYRSFFHGHTFTGNPLACAAAIASLEVFEREDTLIELQPKINLLNELMAGVAAMDEVSEVRGRGMMVGIDLGEHDPALRIGHRVTLEARERGAIVRPLGDTIVLVPPLAISKSELSRLVSITVASIRAAVEGAYGGPSLPLPFRRRRVAPAQPGRAAA